MITLSDCERVKFGFERELVLLRIDDIVPLRIIKPSIKQGAKYAQISNSVKAIGLVEAPIVTPDRQNRGAYFLLDGHLRIEVLKELGATEVDCLISIDDEAYTYNKRISRLVPVQEHRMIVRAVERGVSEERIAEALGLDVNTIKRRFRLLDGVCDEAVALLKDTACPQGVFDILRKMVAIRQVEAAELMLGQNNLSVVFAQALLVATPEEQRTGTQKKKLASDGSAISRTQIARMERELASLQAQVKSVEESYGLDNLHLTVAKGYIARMLGNARVVGWLAKNQPEYLSEFQTIADIDSLGGARPAAE